MMQFVDGWLGCNEFLEFELQAGNSYNRKVKNSLPSLPRITPAIINYLIIIY
jgi:hypothetical protein